MLVGDNGETMKIVVTGGAGFIGSHVVDHYIGDGHDVIVIDNLITGNKKNVHPKAQYFEKDITAPDFVVWCKEKVGMVDIINHHAAQMNVRKSFEDPLFDASANILGTINLLSFAVTANVQRFIFISSGGAIYGPAPLPTSETHSPCPLSPYGLSKYVGEQYVQLYSKLYGIPYIILRYANVYGPRQNPKAEAGVIAIFIESMIKEKEPIIFGNGEQTRDYIYIKDVVQANILALSRGKDQIINIGTGKETTVNRLFSLLQTQIHFPKKVRFAAEIHGELRNSALTIKKAKEILGWEPKIALEEGLLLTLQSYEATK